MGRINVSLPLPSLKNDDTFQYFDDCVSFGNKVLSGAAGVKKNKYDLVLNYILDAYIKCKKSLPKEEWSKINEKLLDMAQTPLGQWLSGEKVSLYKEIMPSKAEQDLQKRFSNILTDLGHPPKQTKDAPNFSNVTHAFKHALQKIISMSSVEQKSASSDDVVKNKGPKGSS